MCSLRILPTTASTARIFLNRCDAARLSRNLLTGPGLVTRRTSFHEGMRGAGAITLARDAGNFYKNRINETGFKGVDTELTSARRTRRARGTSVVTPVWQAWLW